MEALEPLTGPQVACPSAERLAAGGLGRGWLARGVGGEILSPPRGGAAGRLRWGME